jgi:hypothetical protein
VQVARPDPHQLQEVSDAELIHKKYKQICSFFDTSCVKRG